MENPASEKFSFKQFSVSFLAQILKKIAKQRIILLEKANILTLQGPRKS